jgi:Bacterial PH domain
VSTVKFRSNVGIAVAGLVAFFGAVPVATVHWYLAPILLVPLAVLVWGWRAGTDADRDGLTVRALLGGRRLPWARITGLVPDGRRVVAVLDGGTFVRLPAVGPADLPRLVAASGQEVTEPEPATSEPA